MSEPRPGRRPDRRAVPWTRMFVWILTGAVGAYLVLTGIFGIVAKG